MKLQIRTTGKKLTPLFDVPVGSVVWFGGEHYIKNGRTKKALGYSRLFNLKDNKAGRMIDSVVSVRVDEVLLVY